MKLIISLILSYLIGTISGSFIIGNLILKIDVRKFGSKNAGATNAIRVLGKKWGVITFIIDFLKGIGVVIIAQKILYFPNELVLLCILFTIIGHDYPFYMGFKGGKGVATTLGAFAVFNFKLTLICWLIWLLIIFLTKIVSLASIGFLASIIIIYLTVGRYNIYCNLIIIVIGLLGIYRHRANIKRILNKTENKIGNRRKI